MLAGPPYLVRNFRPQMGSTQVMADQPVSSSRRRFGLSFLLAQLPLRGASDPLLNQLKYTDMFAFGGVGFAGRISDGEKAFEEILKRSSASQDFEAVCKAGSREAQCYALVGLRKLHAPLFDDLATAITKGGGTVSTARGCLLSRRPIAEVIGEIRAGAYK